jgi:hypothetical protein
MALVACGGGGSGSAGGGGDRGDAGGGGGDDIAIGHCIAELNAGTEHRRFVIGYVQKSRSVACGQAKPLFDEYFRRRGTEGRGESRSLDIDEWTCSTNSGLLPPSVRSTAADCDDGNGTSLGAFIR